MVVLMDRWTEALKLLGLGWYVALCILAGVGLGLALDHWLDVMPLFTLVGLVIGLLVASIGVYRQLLEVIQGNGHDR